MTTDAPTLNLVEEPGRRTADRGLARRALRRVATAHLVANTLGAIDVFLLLWLVLPPPRVIGGSLSEVFTVNAVAFAVYLPLTLVLGTVWGYRLARPLQHFLEEGRAPTEEERIATLRHPLRSAAVGATLWLVGAALAVALNVRFSGDLAFHVASTIAMGGLTVSALTYLLTERLLRPLTARALADRPPPRLCGPGVQGRLLLAWLLATGVPLLGLLFVGCHVLIEGGSPDRIAASVIVLSGGALAVGLLATVLVARSVGEPLLALRTALSRIEDGHLDVEVAVDDGSEVGLLQSGFNRMTAGLREREQLHDLFGRHVGTEVARDALDRPVALGGEQREVAALFVDVVGSTELAARWSPEEVVALLNRFFTLVVDTVGRHGGWVNKFEGDAALCVFGAPLPDDGCASSALAAARELRLRLERELSEVDVGIGVSAGSAVAGNVGAEHRFEYTVIGDPVNEAARLCELAKGRTERCVVSEAVLLRAGEAERRHWRLDEAITLRGRLEPTRLALPTVERASSALRS
jgi:adenylate cyclase